MMNQNSQKLIWVKIQTNGNPEREKREISNLFVFNFTKFELSAISRIQKFGETMRYPLYLLN